MGVKKFFFIRVLPSYETEESGPSPLVTESHASG